MAQSTKRLWDICIVLFVSNSCTGIWYANHSSSNWNGVGDFKSNCRVIYNNNTLLTQALKGI